MLRDTKKEAKIEEEIFHATLEPWQLKLLAAAEEIRKRGWCRRSLWQEWSGNVCIIGSFFALENGLNYDFAYEHLSREMKQGGQRLSDFLRNEGGGIIYWNDVECSSQAEAIYMLQLCALG